MFDNDDRNFEVIKRMRCAFCDGEGASRSMLYNGSEVVRDVEWVVFDECHYVNDAEVLVEYF